VFGILKPVCKPVGKKALPLYALMKKTNTFIWTPQADAAFWELKKMLATMQILASPLPKEPMLLYIEAINRVVSAVVVVEREEEGKNRAKAGILPEQSDVPLKVKLPSLPEDDLWHVHVYQEAEALL
jgi:hypothetical protein